MSDGRAFGFLRALQLADTFFPSGAYTLSHGLETAVEDGLVRSPDDLERWLRAQLAFQVIPGDAAALVLAWRAAANGRVAEIVAVDHRLEAFRLSLEARDASRKVGRQLLTTTVAMLMERPSDARQALSTPSTSLKVDSGPFSSLEREGKLTQRGSHDGACLTGYRGEVRAGRSPGHAPIALAVACQAIGITCEDAMLVALYSFATSVLGAALRLMRVDHQVTQAILFRLQPILVASQHRCLAEADQGFWTGAPLAEISAMRHRSAVRRSFMT
ncbi:MAG TPA: urease accessory UreF family protein [Chloroflexota bacterium]|nr:urease accessory UreF family protein [Chloroflexota bacterium]